MSAPTEPVLPFPCAVCQNVAVKTLDDSMLAAVKEQLVAEFQPEQIWLFGSHAWGTPRGATWIGSTCSR